MTAFDDVRLFMLRAMGDLVRIDAVRRVSSATLKRELTSDVVGRTIHFRLPRYWAWYVHDGRPSITMPAGKYMIFFPDIKDDPRVDGGSNYPHLKGDRRKLSHDEFKYYAKINRERKRTGQRPIMVVTDYVGPVTGEFFVRDAIQSVALNDVASLVLGHYLAFEFAKPMPKVHAIRL